MSVITIFQPEITVYPEPVAELTVTTGVTGANTIATGAIAAFENDNTSATTNKVAFDDNFEDGIEFAESEDKSFTTALGNKRVYARKYISKGSYSTVGDALTIKKKIDGKVCDILVKDTANGTYEYIHGVRVHLFGSKKSGDKHVMEMHFEKKASEVTAFVKQDITVSA